MKFTRYKEVERALEVLENLCAREGRDYQVYLTIIRDFIESQRELTTKLHRRTQMHESAITAPVRKQLRAMNKRFWFKDWVAHDREKRLANLDSKNQALLFNTIEARILLEEVPEGLMSAEWYAEAQDFIERTSTSKRTRDEVRSS